MSIVEGLQQSDQVRRGGCNHKDMKNLVRTANHIKSSRIPLLWYSGSIDESADDVQSALQHNEKEADLFLHSMNTIDLQTVNHGKDGRKS